MEIEIKKQNLGKIALWGVIAILLIAVVYATFFRETGTATTLGANAGQAASAYSGMVGGC